VVLIDKGSEQNIEPGSPVFIEGGLVGQVISVGYGASRVRLITDRNAKLDVLIQGSRTRGVIQGDGQGTSLLYVQKEEEVKIGDVIVTSGLDGVFPKGVLVGTVTDVLLDKGAIFQSIQVSPSVDVEKLEFVLVSTPGAKPSKGLSASK
jgi:rod shape-determining protein MreC